MTYSTTTTGEINSPFSGTVKPQGYIGDGIYYKYSEDILCLYLSNGIEERNHIYIEPVEMARIKNLITQILEIS